MSGVWSPYKESSRGHGCLEANIMLLLVNSRRLMINFDDDDDSDAVLILSVIFLNRCLQMLYVHLLSGHFIIVG